MAGRKITVVVSQAPGKNPHKRQLEEDLATRMMLGDYAEVSLVPHLYDLPADHHGLMWMKSINSDMVILSWAYPRAIRWILDRNGIRGHEGISLLKSREEEEAEEEAEDSAEAKEQGIELPPPNRKIYAIDLRDHSDIDAIIGEIQRISRESTVSLVTIGGIDSAPPPRYSAPQAIQSPFVNLLAGDGPASPPPAADVRRRWYPVIDYSRCTNCMECLDFCLFGVYGVDGMDRILVEEQDNCKRGCPACSRVCPANAILFPEHKTPSIAGAPVSGTADFKIDLSKLFGAPSALELAAQERDTELVLDGREAVGMSVGIPKRQTETASQPRDELDDLMDQLDAAD